MSLNRIADTYAKAVFVYKKTGQLEQLQWKLMMTKDCFQF